MNIPPETTEVGKCYLSDDGRVRRVVKFISDSQVRYAYRSFPAHDGKLWRTGRLEVERFAETTIRQVPHDWTPETEGA